MSDVDRLVSCLVAHLDTVEKAASDDALLAEHVSASGSEYMYDVRCRICKWERYGGRRSELRPMVASHVRHCHPDQAAAMSPPERLGLVRASRDLIEAWREASARVDLMRAERRHGAEVMRQEGVRDGYLAALRVWARGWGVTGE